MPDDKKRVLDVTIKGGQGEGKTTLLWLMLQTLETFGATVTLHGEDGGDPRHERILRERVHNLRPGNLKDMTVNVTTETIEREED